MGIEEWIEVLVTDVEDVKATVEGYIHRLEQGLYVSITDLEALLEALEHLVPGPPLSA